MCFPTPRRFSVISNLSQTSVWSRQCSSWFAKSRAVRGELRGRNWIWNCTLVSGKSSARGGWLQISPHTHPSGKLPLVTSLWSLRWFWISPEPGCKHNLKSEKRGCFWSSTRNLAGYTVNLKWEKVLFKFTHQTRRNILLASSSDLFWICFWFCIC